MAERHIIRQCLLLAALLTTSALFIADSARARSPFGKAVLQQRGSIPPVIPKVTGPLPITATSHPFGGAAFERVPEDLAKVGYIEEEYLISGTANVYDWEASATVTIRSANAPYTTRMLIRRPLNGRKFSGNVIVEMLNPSNLFDLNLGWAISHKQMVRNGDAWVGITAKPVAAATLKTFDPIRYAAVSWANPLPLEDSRNCTTTGRESPRTTENGLVWDIFNQLGTWLRSRDTTNPLLYRASARRNSPVTHLYAWGYSQTGGFLYTYINAFHARDVKVHGRPIYDAYLIAVASGPTSINQCAAAIPAGDIRRQIRDVGVPVIRVMSGSDYLRSTAARLPDSDTLPNLTRNYEIAGSAHATPDELRFAARPADIERGGRAVPPMECNEGPRSRFPNSVALNAILQNLDLWVRKGVAPPRVPQIAISEGQPVLDKFGNLTGGVRSPYVDVPTSRWYGNATGASFCIIAGYERPFDAALLKELYPTRTAYVKAVSFNVAKLIRERVITEADGKELIAEAAAQ